MLGIIHEEGEPDSPLPAWERTVDIEWHRYTGDGLKEYAAADDFALTLAVFYHIWERSPEHKSTTPERSHYFQLPGEVRFRIAQFLIADHDSGRPLLMNMRGAEQPAWPASSFASLAPMLRSLESSLTACFGLRADIMTTLLMTQRFHLIFSPYVRSCLNPLATRFANRYAGCMQLVTLELDFTRLGFGPSCDATRLAPGNIFVGELVDDWVDAVLEGHGSAPMANLTLLCRRFYGDRPGSEPPVPYVPAAAFTSANSIAALSGLVDSVRIVGFPEGWTTAMVAYLWGADMPGGRTGCNAHLRRNTPSSAWPLIPGQAVRIDYGPSFRRRSSALKRSETTGRVAVRGGGGWVSSPPSYLMIGLDKKKGIGGGGWMEKTKAEEDGRPADEGVGLQLERESAVGRSSWSPKKLQRRLSGKGRAKR